MLYQAATGATRNVRVAAEYTDAVMLAESMLAEHSYVTEETYRPPVFEIFQWTVSSWSTMTMGGTPKAGGYRHAASVPAGSR